MSGSFLVAAIRTIFSSLLPSTQMLHAACERSFGEPILALLGGPTSSSSKDALLERAERVIQLGHHSGIAVLSGLAKSLCAHVMLHFKT